MKSTIECYNSIIVFIEKYIFTSRAINPDTPMTNKVNKTNTHAQTLRIRESYEIHK